MLQYFMHSVRIKVSYPDPTNLSISISVILPLVILCQQFTPVQRIVLHVLIFHAGYLDDGVLVCSMSSVSH